MNVYSEIKEIAELNARIEELTKKVNEKIDADGLDFTTAVFVKGCMEKDGHLYTELGNKLDRDGLVDDDYYCDQSQGYIEDDFYGHLYFATDEKGTFVRVYFNV